MEPQLPPAPSPAYHHPQPQHRAPIDIGYAYNEKHAYEHHQYALRVERGSKGSSKSRAHDSVISHPLSPNPATPSPPSPASSVSSAPRKHRAKRESQRSQDTIDVVPQPARAHVVDPEKADGSQHRSRTPTRVSASNPEITHVVYDSGEYHEKGPEDKPVQLLLYLSLPCALLSFLIMLWTMVALLISLLLQPFRLFSSRSTLPTQLTTFLAPPLNLQLHLIYSFSSSTEYSAPMLVVVHLFSPFVAVGVAIAAWTAAFFWFFSAILGDPAGQDGHNDGKESILGVRNWWDRWLSRALR
ncbi:hypothetical protein N0V90_005539 [Kalmusia sp. IMI 367209]|nr:hypothetical protein N0V90_005539 [Kalmusia sp. IMI 367209]